MWKGQTRDLKWKLNISDAREKQSILRLGHWLTVCRAASLCTYQWPPLLPLGLSADRTVFLSDTRVSLNINRRFSTAPELSGWTYYVLLLTHEALNGLGPSYIANSCQCLTFALLRSRFTRSLQEPQEEILHTSFVNCTPQLWNKSQADIKEDL